MERTYRKRLDQLVADVGRDRRLREAPVATELVFVLMPRWLIRSSPRAARWPFRHSCPMRRGPACAAPAATTCARIGIEGVVVNAFHLLRRPGARVIQAAGGIHRFMDWDGPIVSDSGGFQIWSLIRQDPNRGVIRDNEVIFREPTTGEKWNLTPERMVGLQLQLGSDIVVCLDDCTDADAPESEQERSVERTVRWARRSRAELTGSWPSGVGLPHGLRGRAGRRHRAAAAAMRHRPTRDRFRWLRLRRLAALRRRHAARGAVALRPIGPARVPNARARRRPPR